mmetsp:Transcript_47004/g.63974  ORF Transcript_47004/g.63974 Transcript_47004/m.63974 type:complete len:332 (-) Transcript_47004:260-1255(-)
MLWTRRQEELSEAIDAMEEPAHVIDALIQVLNNKTASQEEILNALDLLDYHLSDMDMAKDFHDALGGWQPLTALLDGTEHPYLQAAAALVVGTTIKNQLQFQNWLLDEPPQSVPMMENVYGRSTPLLSLSTMLRHGVVAMNEGDHMGTLVVRRALYALGSGLRHHEVLQEAFVSVGGLTSLSNALRVAATVKEWSIVVKVSGLVDDLLSEVDQVRADAGYTNGDTDHDAVAASPPSVHDTLHSELRSPEWCTAIALGLDSAASVKAWDHSLHALVRQLPHCRTCKGDKSGDVLVAKLEALQTSLDHHATEADLLYIQELKDLAGTCLLALS